MVKPQAARGHRNLNPGQDDPFEAQLLPYVLYRWVWHSKIVPSAYRQHLYVLYGLQNKRVLLCCVLTDLFL